jgi:hypothetical protein
MMRRDEPVRPVFFFLLTLQITEDMEQSYNVKQNPVYAMNGPALATTGGRKKDNQQMD